MTKDISLNGLILYGLIFQQTAKETTWEKKTPVCQFKQFVNKYYMSITGEFSVSFDRSLQHEAKLKQNSQHKFQTCSTILIDILSWLSY